MFLPNNHPPYVATQWHTDWQKNIHAAAADGDDHDDDDDYDGDNYDDDDNDDDDDSCWWRLRSIMAIFAKRSNAEFSHDTSDDDDCRCNTKCHLSYTSYSSHNTKCIMYKYPQYYDVAAILNATSHKVHSSHT